MNHTFEFRTDEEKENIISQNNNKFLIEINYLITGNTLVFSDKKPIELRIAELENAQKQQDQITLDNAMKLAMLETNNII